MLGDPLGEAELLVLLARDFHQFVLEGLALRALLPLDSRDHRVELGAAHLAGVGAVPDVLGEHRGAIELEPRRLLDLVQRRRHAALELLVELGQGGGVHACAVVGTVVR